MMNKVQKKNYISEMKKFFEASDSVLVTHYQGLSVNQLDVLRAEMRKHGIIFKIMLSVIIPCYNEYKTI